MTTAEQARAELAGIDVEALAVAHAEAQKAVEAAQVAYDKRAAELAGQGIQARVAHRGAFRYAPGVASLAKTLDVARLQRRLAAERLRRAENLQRVAESGRDRPEFRVYVGAPAGASGGEAKRLVLKDGVPIVEPVPDPAVIAEHDNEDRAYVGRGGFRSGPRRLFGE